MDRPICVCKVEFITKNIPTKKSAFAETTEYPHGNNKPRLLRESQLGSGHRRQGESWHHESLRENAGNLRDFVWGRASDVTPKARAVKKICKSVFARFIDVVCASKESTKSREGGDPWVAQRLSICLRLRPWPQGPGIEFRIGLPAGSLLLSPSACVSASLSVSHE